MAIISFITKFDLTLTPTKQFVFTDTSDYPGQSILTSDVNGCFTIIAPSGVTIYQNLDFSDSGCDIKISTSTTDQKTIPLPIDANDLVELGTYNIIYTVYDKNLLVEYTVTNTYDNEYVPPIISISHSVNIIGQIFSQTDTTNYVVNGVNPSTFTRVNKLIYPQGIRGGAPAPLTTSAITLSTTVFYNGTQTSTITSGVIYTFTDGLIVIDSLYGSEEINVDGAYYCSIMCGLKAYSNKLNITDTQLRKIYEDNFKLATSYLVLVMGLIDCNGGDKISQYLDKINDIIGDCNCGCEDDDNFSRVLGWGSIIGTNGTDGINGTNGTNGSTWYSGTGAPSGSVGVINDWYIDIASANIYKKTSGSTWTLEFNINGAAGAAGLAGAGVLVNDVAVTAPVGKLGVHIPNTFKTYTLLAGQMKTDGDVLELTTTVAIVLPTTANIAQTTPCFACDVNLTIAGTSMNPSIQDTVTTLNPAIPMQGSACVYADISATITRLTATTISIDFNVTETGSNKVILPAACYSWKESTITVNNLTSATNVINIDVYSNAPTTTAAGSYWTIAITQLLIKYFAK